MSLLWLEIRRACSLPKKSTIEYFKITKQGIYQVRIVMVINELNAYYQEKYGKKRPIQIYPQQLRNEFVKLILHTHQIEGLRVSV